MSKVDSWNPDQIGAFKVTIDLQDGKRDYSSDFGEVINVIPGGKIPESQSKANLIEGFNVYRRFMPFPSSPYLDELLRWIQENYDKVRDPDRPRLKSDFACLRGALTTILVAGFERQKFKIVARKLSGTIYFVVFKVSD
jgi:hypothetical protein